MAPKDISWWRAGRQDSGFHVDPGREANELHDAQRMKHHLIEERRSRGGPAIYERSVVHRVWALLATLVIKTWMMSHISMHLDCVVFVDARRGSTMRLGSEAPVVRIGHLVEYGDAGHGPDLFVTSRTFKFLVSTSAPSSSSSSTGSKSKSTSTCSLSSASSCPRPSACRESSSETRRTVTSCADFSKQIKAPLPWN